MDIEQGARIIVQKWLHAQPDDVFHFITDETTSEEGRAFVQAAEEVGTIPKLTILPADSIQAGENILEMRSILSCATAIIGATRQSFITTSAVDYALHHGARFLSVPMSTNDGSSLLEQDFLKEDPKAAFRMGQPILRCLRGSTSLRVTTKAGTDIQFDIHGRKPGLFCGTAFRAGACASASFEAYIPPNEFHTHGKVVLDGSMGYIGLTEQPFAIEFEDGVITDIELTSDGLRFREYLDSFSDLRMYRAAEAGIGLNRLAKCRGVSYIEDESSFGTFHIGFGRNIALGGRHPAKGHFDIVIRNPTIMTDSAVIMKEGEYCALF